MQHGWNIPLYLPLAALVLGTSACGSAPRAGQPSVADAASDSRPGQAPGTQPVRYDLTEAEYVGSSQCAKCGHEKVHTDWADSLHTKMFQKVGPGVILGNFANQTLEYLGWRFRMYRKGSDYYIQELTDAGKETIYRVDYTLGARRIQHYLSVRPDGSIRVTFPTWDNLEKEWIHGSEIVRGAHSSTGELIALPIQIWNKHCWNCHTSQEEEGFDLLTETYNTTFTEPGINCEMCHGPGSIHVERMEKNPKDPFLATVNAMRLPKEERMVDCLQCHARRIMVKKGFQVGQNFYDYYQLRLVDLAPQPRSGSPIWVDRARRFANECLLLWESQCFLKGDATCVSCHDAHQVTISRDPRYQNTDVLCTQCHKEYLDPKFAADHTRHPLSSQGSRCIECHMLPITKKNIKLLQNAEIRDHLINSPIPENTVRHAIPNACNNFCHEDKPVEWVIEWMDKWYPNRARSDFVEDTLALARQRKPEAVPALIRMARGSDRGVIARASAVALLGEFQGEEVARVLIEMVADPEVIVRAEAARSLSELGHPASVAPLKIRLSDPARTVRLNAVFALIKMGILELDDEYSAAYIRAKNEYLDFLQEFPTVFETRVDLGTYYAVHEKYEEALVEYKNARKLRPESPAAHYYIGITLAQLGLLDEALGSLQEALRIDAGYRNTREIIEQIRAVKKPR
ncbi:MAG: tetratricopeptide repeat protein [Acidobacteria bacterium]|nr:tetratricopeptide repeat protein [Acidobacteriota bacterium]